MAAVAHSPKPSTAAAAAAGPAVAVTAAGNSIRDVAASYLGISFAVFLAFLPQSSISYISSLQSRNRILSLRLFDAEDQIKQIKSRRREDSRANARVAEILAGQRNAWQQEERRILSRIDAAEEENEMLHAEVADLRAEVERLKGEVSERDEMLDFIAQGVGDGDADLEDSDRYAEYGGNGDVDGYKQQYQCYDNELSRQLPDRLSGWKEMQYDSLESMYQMKHLAARRESPWKVDGESISSKLTLLEHELSNLENVVKGDLSKIPSLMRKQAKRYQSLSQKIDNLCQKMQASDPCEPAISPEFRTQRQTEFLREAFLLQSRAKETRQKLSSLQVESTKSFQGGELSCQAVLSTKRSLDLIRNNLKEIQRNMEIWLARIVGDLEGILATDGASRLRDYYISRYSSN